MSRLRVSARKYGWAVWPSVFGVGRWGRTAAFAAVVMMVAGGVCLPAAAQTVLATDTVGSAPNAVAVNPATNTTYVANLVSGTVSVINGSTNAVSSVTVGTQPYAVAVNPVTTRST